MPRQRRRPVPEVLWRLFGARARTLSATITSLVPSLRPSICPCKGSSCIQCCRDATSFLLRGGDPKDYGKLINCAYLVVNDGAPPLQFDPSGRWPQLELMRRTIEITGLEQPSNLICCDYNKVKQSSPILERLTSSAWALLHERVGDCLMVYLLKHASIFLPLSHNTFHQVAGSPVKLQKHMPKAQFQNPSVTQSGTGKKRKRVDNISSASQMQPLNSYSNIGDALTGAAAAKEKGDVSGELQQSSNQSTRKCKKRCRSSRLLCHRKWRKLNLQEFADKISCTNNQVDEGSSVGKVQPHSSIQTYDFHTQCCCSLIYEVPQLISERHQIDRQSMLYSMERSLSGLPQNHVLKTLKPNISGSKSLLEKIFGLSDGNASAQSMSCFHSTGSFLLQSGCQYHYLVRLLKMLIHRSRRCNYLRLLEKHCALPILDSMAARSSSTILESEETGMETHDTQSESTRAYCSKSQVVSFIWAVCRSIVPPDLLGSPSNWRILRSNISKFLGLRKFEKFSVRQCIYKLKTSSFPFLSSKYPSCECDVKSFPGQNANIQKLLRGIKDSLTIAKHKLFVNWIFWFFSCLVVPLIQANFYVTESEHGKHDLYYYRKSAWMKLTDGAINCLKDGIYNQLNEAAVRNILSKRSFGFSKLRLRPKKTGVRMLANLKAPSRLPKKVFCSRVLKGLQLKEPEKLGSSVFDYNDVYRRLCPFLMSLRNVSTTLPGLFIVVSDVSKAFDSVIQDKLISVMKEVIVEDEYLLQQSCQVICMEKSLWEHENVLLTDRTSDTDLTSFTPCVPFRSLHSILVNQGCSRLVKKEDICFNLKEHLKQNVVQFDKNFYLQIRGIPQGSVLSSLLCSLYYGHMERNLIIPLLERVSKDITEDLLTRQISSSASTMQNLRDVAVIAPLRYLLLRFIDDFLFISMSKELAAAFFSMLKGGIPDYNCYMNNEKFCSNFDIGRQLGHPSNRVCVSEEGIPYICWSGLLINSCTLEVQADYSRYLNNHLRSALTVRWQDRPGQNLKRKVCDFLRPKCHTIFFDSNINSAAVVRLNIYQGFLLCAMKFHCYVSELSYICKLRAQFYLKIIMRSLRYMYRLIRRRMHSSYGGHNFRPILNLQDQEVKWLGLHAYIQVLKRKQSRHKVLLSLLNSKYCAHKLTGNTSSDLNYAIERSNSSLLWRIKY
ncbi:hypothetical protein SLA2020_331570 [Shorea laevis]